MKTSKDDIAKHKQYLFEELVSAGILEMLADQAAERLTDPHDPGKEDDYVLASLEIDENQSVRIAMDSDGRYGVRIGDEQCSIDAALRLARWLNEHSDSLYHYKRRNEDRGMS